MSHEKDVIINDSVSASDSVTEQNVAAKTETGKEDFPSATVPPPPPLHVVPSSNTDPEAGRLERPSTAGTDVETYPEGGLRAWLVVLGSWLALVSSLGIMNTLATFQTYLTAHQLAHYDEGTVGWVFSIYTFVVFFLGLYIGPLFDKYGPKWIVLAGTVLLFASLMLFSISTGKFDHPFLPLGSHVIQQTQNLPRGLAEREECQD